MSMLTNISMCIPMLFYGQAIARRDVTKYQLSHILTRIEKAVYLKFILLFIKRRKRKKKKEKTKREKTMQKTVT